MKKIMAAAIVLVFAGASTSWGFFGLGDFSYDGSLEISGNSANNETDFSPANDKRGRTATRVRVGVNGTVTEGVEGRVEFTRSGRQYGTAPTSIAGEEALWIVQNAYIDVEGFLGLNNLRVGRQYVGEAGDLVWNISPTDDDSLTTGAIDGLLAEWAGLDDKLAISVFTGKAAEDDGIANTDAGDATGDANLTNVEVHLKEVIPNGRIRLGLLSGDDQNTAVRSDDNKLRTYRLGVDGSAKEGMFTYRAEYLQNAGSFNGAGLTGAGGATDLDYGGNAIDLGFGVNFPETEVGTFGVAINIVSASGDDDVIDSDDDSFHDFSPIAGNTSDRLFGEIFGKSNTLGGGTPLGQGVNTSAAGTGGAVAAAAPAGATQGQGLQVIHIGGNYNPSWFEKGSIKIDFYSFKRAEDSVRTAAGTTTQIGDDIGTEIDVTLGYDHSENVDFELGYATLSPDDALTGIGAVNDENITKWFARGKVKWGGEE